MHYFTLYTRFCIVTSVILLIIGKILAKSTDHSCSVTKYRATNGICNNLQHIQWGATNRTYLRLLPAVNDHLIKKLPSVEKIIRNLSPLIQNISQQRHHSSQINGLFLMWSELLRLDLDSPAERGEDLYNEATTYLDASFLYGKGENDESNLIIRLPDGSLTYEFCTQCNGIRPYEKELLTLLVNEHNRIWAILRTKFPKWSIGTLFEETRRTLIAEIQHITYEEYLPALLGAHLTKELRRPTYNESIESGIYTAVSEIFFKVVRHSGSNQNFSSAGLDDRESHNIALRLMQQSNSDLFSLNHEQIYDILKSQRRRGIPLYGEWMQFCQNKLQKFETNISSHFNYNQNTINSMYGSSSNVDLLVGELLASRVPHGHLGPTMACILRVQFENVLRADRFWYSNKNTDHSFSEAQLNELQQVTFSSLICFHMNDLESVTKNAFLKYNFKSNQLTNCSQTSIPQLMAWKSSGDTFKNSIREKLIRDAIHKAEDDLTRRKQTEYLLWSNQGGVDPKSPIGTAAAFSKPNRNALLLANNSILLEYASKELLYSLRERSATVRRKRQLFDGDDSILSISDDLSGDFLQDLDISGFLPDALRTADNSCPAEVGACDPSYPYRSYTGYCNNLRKPNYGKSLTTFTRLLPPVYENGISKPRQHSVMGIALPSPRLVSSMMHLDISHLHSKHSLMYMQFAQFLDHDITFTPVHRGFFASIPDCRPCDSPITVHPECMPIEVPAGDPYYPQINFTSGQRFCLPFMRSLPGQQRLGSREQINQNSAFLDASQVYGEHACLARQLRSHQGRLNVTRSLFGDKELLPQSASHPECKASSGYCFIAGDGRASEQPGLTTIHTIFMREHNRLADGLRFVNPHWDDEHLYQQARRILIAEYQHIVYHEFLPRLLGHNAMNLYGLKLEPNNLYFKAYSDECNPSVMTEFATAAFRIGHSLLRPHIPRMSPLYQSVEPSILLRDTFFNPDVIYQRHIVDEITRGLLSTPMETLDQFITKEITNHLFEDKRIPHSGMDLPALNVQRARDHGIPSYNEYRAMCNLKRATTWEDFSKELPSDVISRLKRVYPTVDDVDLFPAGVSERPLPGGLIGPTFGCIIGIQFRQLRNCDRFWYETADPIPRFSIEQLSEIRKASLAKILCENLDIQTPVQRSAFDLPHDENVRFPCHSLANINLKAWKDTGQHCQFGGRIVGIGESYLPTPCTSCICTPQGARCATIRVTDCNKLIQEVGHEAVLKDEICSVQCNSYITNVNGKPSSIVDRLPPVTSQGRGINFYHAAGLRPPAPPSNFPRSRNPSTRSFKLRDFSIVVG